MASPYRLTDMATQEPAANASPTVSAIVVCFNEENNIRRCLESLRWCDEIVVVDSFSTDRTLEICKQFTDRVLQRSWAGYRDQKAFAHSQATKQWVILVDSDERVPPELQQEIREVLKKDAGRYAGYAIPRLVFYLNRWWRRGGWYPDYAVRLFRRDRGRWGGQDPHEKILVDGRVKRLRHPLHHFTYRDMADHLARINSFTSISARELKAAGQTPRVRDALLRPAARFFSSYVLKRGFMEGFAGFYVAVSAAMYVFLKYAKLWELNLEDEDDVGRKPS
jgi:glycosyltransferase involved in cell wall biosynthesis